LNFDNKINTFETHLKSSINLTEEGMRKYAIIHADGKVRKGMISK